MYIHSVQMHIAGLALWTTRRPTVAHIHVHMLMSPMLDLIASKMSQMCDYAALVFGIRFALIFMEMSQLGVGISLDNWDMHGMYMYTYIYIYVKMRIFMHKYMCIPIYTASKYMCTRWNICMHKYMYIPIQTSSKCSL